jgi:hypothetical protein
MLLEPADLSKLIGSLLIISVFAFFALSSGIGGADAPPKSERFTLFRPGQISDIDCEGQYKRSMVYYSVKIMTYTSDPSNPQPDQYGETFRTQSSDGLVDAEIEVPESGEFYVQVDAETDCIRPYRTICNPKNCSKQYYKITSPRATNIHDLVFMNYDFDGERCCN